MWDVLLGPERSAPVSNSPLAVCDSIEVFFFNLGSMVWQTECIKWYKVCDVGLTHSE